jgi:hypothetical protein
MKTILKPTIYILFGIVAGLSFALGLAFKPDRNEGLTIIKPDGRLQYKWYAPQLPQKIDFAGEAAPLDRRDVRESLDRELINNYYSHISTLTALKLSSRWFPVIEARLKANGIPDDFKYLCVAESHLQNQTSRAGAVGFWQFMPGTAPRYGIEINDDVDERYNVLKSTDAACQYFKEAYAKFGSWTAAAASYNCGMGGYNNFSNTQQQTNFYDILFLEETNRYVFRILALKYLMSGAQTIGYIVQDSDAYKPVPVTTVQVSSTIPNLVQWALDNGTTYKALKTQNPWLRSRSLPVRGGKSYMVEIPKS